VQETNWQIGDDVAQRSLGLKRTTLFYKLKRSASREPDDSPESDWNYDSHKLVGRRFPSCHALRQSQIRAAR